MGPGETGEGKQGDDRWGVLVLHLSAPDVEKSHQYKERRRKMINHHIGLLHRFCNVQRWPPVQQSQPEPEGKAGGAEGKAEKAAPEALWESFWQTFRESTAEILVIVSDGEVAKADSEDEPFYIFPDDAPYKGAFCCFWAWLSLWLVYVPNRLGLR